MADRLSPDRNIARAVSSLAPFRAEPWLIHQINVYGFLRLPFDVGTTQNVMNMDARNARTVFVQPRADLPDLEVAVSMRHLIGHVVQQLDADEEDGFVAIIPVFSAVNRWRLGYRGGFANLSTRLFLSVYPPEDEESVSRGRQWLNLRNYDFWSEEIPVGYGGGPPLPVRLDSYALPTASWNNGAPLSGAEAMWSCFCHHAVQEQHRLATDNRARAVGYTTTADLIPDAVFFTDARAETPGPELEDSVFAVSSESKSGLGFAARAILSAYALNGVAAGSFVDDVSRDTAAVPSDPDTGDEEAFITARFAYGLEMERPVFDTTVVPSDPYLYVFPPIYQTLPPNVYR